MFTSAGLTNLHINFLVLTQFLEMEFKHKKEQTDSKLNPRINLWQYSPFVNLCGIMCIVTFFVRFLLSPTREFFVEHCRGMHIG